MGLRYEGAYAYYDNVVCPVCGHRPHTATQCQRLRARICMSCCEGCPYYFNVWNPSCSYLLSFERKERLSRLEFPRASKGSAH